MKFTSTQSELSSSLSLVSRAVPSRPSHPVLANILLSADPKTQRVSLTGFDLSLGIQMSFAAQVEEAGLLTLPAKLLTDIVSRLPDGEVTLDNSEDEAIAMLTCASGRYQVRGMGAEEYPELPALEGNDVVNLPADALIEGLKGTLFSTSTDETKQVLTGVHLATQTDGLEFAATDGHRLAVVQTLMISDVEGEAKPVDLEPFEVTVPGKTLRELERMLQSPQSSDAIAIQFDPSQLVVEWENQRLTSRLLEGQYPNYRQLIPATFEVQLTVERRLFIGALERIAVFADQKNNIVKLTLDTVQQEVVISVDAQDVGSARESVPSQISGEGMEIAFNVRYLIDGLKAVGTSEVQMQFNTPTSPSIVTPLGGLKMTYLVMPVQIRS